MRHLFGNMFGVSGFGANDSTACQTEDVDGWTKSSHDKLCDQNPGPGGFWPVVNECVVSTVVLSEVVEEDFVVSPVVKPGFFCSAAAGLLFICCNRFLKLTSGMPSGLGCLKPTSGVAVGSGWGAAITGSGAGSNGSVGAGSMYAGAAAWLSSPIAARRVAGAPVHPAIANIKRTVTCQ